MRRPSPLGGGSHKFPILNQLSSYARLDLLSSDPSPASQVTEAPNKDVVVCLMQDSTVVQGREPFSTSATRLEAPKQHCDHFLHQECKITPIHADLARPRSRIVFFASTRTGNPHVHARGLGPRGSSEIRIALKIGLVFVSYGAGCSSGAYSVGTGPTKHYAI